MGKEYHSYKGDTVQKGYRRGIQGAEGWINEINHSPLIFNDFFALLIQ